jgi:hypothetical protein
MYNNLETFQELGYSIADTSKFEILEYAAQQILNLCTFDRLIEKPSLLETYNTAVQHCMAELIVFDENTKENVGISSFNNGKVSVSYGNSQTADSIFQSKKDICYRYLPVALLNPVADWEQIT